MLSDTSPYLQGGVIPAICPDTYEIIFLCMCLFLFFFVPPPLPVMITCNALRTTATSVIPEMPKKGPVKLFGNGTPKRLRQRAEPHNLLEK
jgi:hypothetical protein